MYRNRRLNCSKRERGYLSACVAVYTASSEKSWGGCQLSRVLVSTCLFRGGWIAIGICLREHAGIHIRLAVRCNQLGTCGGEAWLVRIGREAIRVIELSKT